MGWKKNIHKQVEFTPLNPQIVYPTLLFEGALCSFSSRQNEAADITEDVASHATP